MPGLQLYPTKDHPVQVLVQALYHNLIRNIKTMLQDMKPHHEPNPLRLAPPFAVKRHQSIRYIGLVNPFGQKNQLMILLQWLLKNLRENVILLASIIGHGLSPPNILFWHN
jgi:hypothetical protein